MFHFDEIICGFVCNMNIGLFYPILIQKQQAAKYWIFLSNLNLKTVSNYILDFFVQFVVKKMSNT